MDGALDHIEHRELVETELEGEGRGPGSDVRFGRISLQLRAAVPTFLLFFCGIFTE